MKTYTLPYSILLVILFVNQAALADNFSSNHGCNPCTFEISNSIPKYIFKLDTKPMDDRVIVHKILVSSETTTNIVQTLTPVDMSPTILSAVPFILKADIDINHDGYKDLFLVTSGSSSQIGGNYWIFNPKKKQFVYSGNYPELIMENTRNDIAAVVNSGYDLQYKEFYEFINGQMMKIKTIERKNISPTEDMLTTKIRVLNSWKITSQIKVPAGRW